MRILFRIVTTVLGVALILSWWRVCHASTAAASLSAIRALAGCSAVISLGGVAYSVWKKSRSGRAS